LSGPPRYGPWPPGPARPRRAAAPPGPAWVRLGGGPPPAAATGPFGFASAGGCWRFPGHLSVFCFPPLVLAWLALGARFSPGLRPLACPVRRCPPLLPGPLGARLPPVWCVALPPLVPGPRPCCALVVALPRCGVRVCRTVCGVLRGVALSCVPSSLTCVSSASPCGVVCLYRYSGRTVCGCHLNMVPFFLSWLPVLSSAPPVVCV